MHAEELLAIGLQPFDNSLSYQFDLSCRKEYTQ